MCWSIYSKAFMACCTMIQKDKGIVMRTVFEQPIGQFDEFYVTEAVFNFLPRASGLKMTLFTVPVLMVKLLPVIPFYFTL